jgi:tetratricopeptide (TPR) repeat protein
MDDLPLRKKRLATEHAETRVWRREEESVVEQLATGQVEQLIVDPIGELRALIRAVRNAPRDGEVRRKLRAHAAEHALWEPLAMLLADEAHVQAPPDVMAAFYEELADVHENLDQPIETIAAMEAVVALQPRELAHHDRLAWLYRRAGAWQKAAESFERVAALAKDDRARAALRAAGKLYRDNGRLDRAADIYRAIVARRPGDLDAWKALDELLTALKRWRELADVRAARAELASGVDKAALLRAQARALEQAGEKGAAAEVVALAARHAPEDVSGIVDYADVLAREGRGGEAAEVLASRIDEAIDRGAPADQVAALRLRLVGVLDDQGERVRASLVLEDLLAAQPEHVPALERAAERETDPRRQAELWLRLAATDGPHRLHALIAAGKKLGELGEHRRAARTLEEATELAPADEELRRTLDEARTAAAIARAQEEIAAGDRAAAERRLRNVLVTRPYDVAANLALADALPAEAAAAHLEEVVGELPNDISNEHAAKLVHRLARAVAMRGDLDESHQLLHEAHRLARRDLAITLALGESCLARKLWREAAIHLGSLAEHPDAPAHAAAVAAGLVSAAKAEIRALRPANAEKHYLAAVKLDPGCARAWHALAEIAMERDDMVRATECLEREAQATSEPRDRLRLYDALGDLAETVLGDVARAERYWREVPTSVGVLDKLLRVQRKRGAAAERGETCERLAELDPARRKDLLEEATQAYAAGADARALAVAERLMAEHPTDVDAVACASAVPGDPVRIAQWLKRALTAWEKDGKKADGDPRRADLWRRLGDAERSRGDETSALRAYQRAVSTAPESDGALAARRGLVDLAASHGRDADTSRIALVEAHQDVDDILAWARGLAAAGNTEDARAAFELAGALGAALDDDLPIARSLAADEVYGTTLDDTERRALVDDEDEGPLAGILALLAEAAQLLCTDTRSALIDAGFADARRVSATSDSAAAAMLPKITKALGGPATLLHQTARMGADLALVLGAPPLVVIGPRLAASRARTPVAEDLADLELRFRIGRIVELARPHRVFAAAPGFELLVAGLRHAFGPPAPYTEAIAAEAERLKTALPLLLRRKIAARVEGATLDAGAYRAACERAADRAGLLACGHVGVAVELAGGAEAARHLVKLASTQRYLAARRKLRVRR